MFRFKSSLTKRSFYRRRCKWQAALSPTMLKAERRPTRSEARPQPNQGEVGAIKEGDRRLRRGAEGEEEKKGKDMVGNMVIF